MTTKSGRIGSTVRRQTGSITRTGGPQPTSRGRNICLFTATTCRFPWAGRSFRITSSIFLCGRATAFSERDQRLHHFPRSVVRQLCQNTANLPVPLANTVGTGIMSTYVPQHLSGVSVSQTAQQYFGSANGVPICQADPAEVHNIPCSQPMLDAGNFAATAIRNGTQWFVRADKDWEKDRIYGSVYRTTLGLRYARIDSRLLRSQQQLERAFQFNYAHTFSPPGVNEGIFGTSRVEGKQGRRPELLRSRYRRNRIMRSRAVRNRIRAGRLHPAQLPLARCTDPRSRGAHPEVRLRGLVWGRRRALPGSLVAADLQLQQSARSG